MPCVFHHAISSIYFTMLSIPFESVVRMMTINTVNSDYESVLHTPFRVKHLPDIINYGLYFKNKWQWIFWNSKECELHTIQLSRDCRIFNEKWNTANVPCTCERSGYFNPLLNPKLEDIFDFKIYPFYFHIFVKLNFIIYEIFYLLSP